MILEQQGSWMPFLFLRVQISQRAFLLENIIFGGEDIDFYYFIVLKIDFFQFYRSEEKIEYSYRTDGRI